MPDNGLAVVAELPFACTPGSLAAAQLHSSRLLLRVVNLIDQHEPEPDKAHERIEAKLDLMLHWLGLQLFGAEAARPAIRLRLGSDSVTWACDDAPPAPGEGVLALGLHPALAAPLRLPCRVLECRDGEARAELVFTDEELADAWTQWLFRLHRRAVQEARQRHGPD